MGLRAADTAFAIATIRANETSLFVDPYASTFAAAATPEAAEGTTRFMSLPFFVDAIRLRTRFIDDFVRDELALGASQVVLLGAGFDTRALRIPEMANVITFEVDFAVQLAQKRALLKDLAAHVKHVECDFESEDFAEALAVNGFHAGSRTLFVWEGVIAYLGADVVQQSLERMARIGGPGSALVFDFSPMATAIDPLRSGFSTFDHVPLDAVWRKYLPGEPPENASYASMGIARI